LPESERRLGPFPVIASTGPVGTHNKAMVHGPGVVIGRSGSLGGGQFIEGDFWPLNTTLWVKDFKGNDRRFCYYLLKSLDLTQFNAGSGVPTLNRNHIHPLPVTIPKSLAEQRAIAHILGTLDDKIELNRRMSETLEAMARALFKAWFVDFEPVRAKCMGDLDGRPRWQRGQSLPGLPARLYDLFPDRLVPSELGEIPEGWRVGTFGDCCTVKGGYAFKSKDFAEKGYPLVRIKNITSYYTVDLFDVVYIPEEIALKTKDFFLNDGDLIIAMTGATIGKFGLIVNRDDTKKALLNQRVGKIVPNIISVEKAWFPFISLLVTDVYEQIVNIGSGSAQPNISSSQIEGCKFIVPDNKLIIYFTNKINPLMEKWLLNIKESRTLAALRDALLPKLISGRIRVKDAERFLKERGL
ncbi:MAG: restriction endonuclease subunit S, partial [candidate division KSB1 bacterium]|nr:restriction endonuclease subunit S [candidate division KSB1 bacterium]